MNRIFAVVGIVFGAVFVFVNAPALPDPWLWIARAVGAVLLVVAVIFGVLRARPATSSPDPRSARVYWIAVLAGFTLLTFSSFQRLTSGVAATS